MFAADAVIVTGCCCSWDKTMDKTMAVAIDTSIAVAVFCTTDRLTCQCQLIRSSWVSAVVKLFLNYCSVQQVGNRSVYMIEEGFGYGLAQLFFQAGT